MLAAAPPLPKAMPSWLNEADLAHFVTQFRKGGFSGPLNWYRNIDFNWELTSAFNHAQIRVPSMYLAGEQDPVVHFPGSREMISHLKSFLPRLFRAEFIERCGHWTQQEQPEQVNRALGEFLSYL